MIPMLEILEDRLTPSTAVVEGTLLVREVGAGTHTVSVDSVAGQFQVTEGDGSGQNNVVTAFNAATVQRVRIEGAASGVNVIQQNTSLSTVIVLGSKGDTAFGGTGSNTIFAGQGKDTIYALLGSNTIYAKGGNADRVFTNFGATVFADNTDTVVRFFGPGRTPGTPFIGFDNTLNDGVLYITPTNNGSNVQLFPGQKAGDVLAVYELGDGQGYQAKTFSGVRYISYFGGTGADVFANYTTISDAIYGSGGSDTLTGGTGDFSVIKGSGGNDTVTGRATRVDLSGNGGTDTLVRVEKGNKPSPGDVYRTDAADMVFGFSFAGGDINLSP